MHIPKLGGDIRTLNLSPSPNVVSDTFSAMDLTNSRIIGQVDNKFIACLLQNPKPILALVDQHAADERVRVERYLKKLCTEFLQGEVEAFRLDKPGRVLLTRRECDILATNGVSNTLERWGLWVELEIPLSQVSPSAEGAGFVQVNVAGVPDAVASKLTTERELESFLKAMIANIESSEVASLPITPLAVQDQNNWVKALRYCPAPLLELVNSKACRGAIMFNDPLDQGQSQIMPSLMLDRRPSVAPLAKLAGPDSMLSAVDWRAFDEED
ncbi:DNA mismatch repair protein MutL [Ceratobasidium sp. AG-Ba]|nr:DNA mismatch repair protein MutL [Ceratobasidium sp. AG-Ba]